MIASTATETTTEMMIVTESSEIKRVDTPYLFSLIYFADTIGSIGSILFQ